nr:site-specific integrase [Nostoc sp. DedSLP01]
MAASRPPREPPSSRWPLLQAGYAQSTTKKYHAAVRDFYGWCKATNEDPRDVVALDECLADYFHAVYDEKEGKGKQKARDTLYGIEMYLPRVKGQLLIAGRVVNRWTKLRVAESYPPLTWDLATLVGVHIANSGHFRFGVATVLAFDCLLRVGELTNLRRDDVAFPHDRRMGAEYKITTLSIRVAKTGRNQSVTVADPQVVALLRHVVAATKPGALLFPGGSSRFRDVFKRACNQLGLSSKYVPHSLRHGGATRLYLQGMRLEDIMVRGRWASSKSARTYIQSSRAVLMAMTPPRAVAEAAAAVAQALTFSFALTQKH